MKAEKVFEVADQKHVGMTIAYAVSDGDDGYYASKVAEPEADDDYFTGEELFQAFVAGTLVAKTTDGYERIVTLDGGEYSGSTVSFADKPVEDPNSGIE